MGKQPGTLSLPIATESALISLEADDDNTLQRIKANMGKRGIVICRTTIIVSAVITTNEDFR